MPLHQDLSVTFRGTSLADIKGFEPIAVNRIGHQIRLLQKGTTPSTWKSLSRVGAGVFEFKVNSLKKTYRVICAREPGKIVILHAFEKRTQKARKHDLDLARDRLNDPD